MQVPLSRETVSPGRLFYGQHGYVCVNMPMVMSTYLWLCQNTYFCVSMPMFVSLYESNIISTIRQVQIKL